jgi:hypothetical protein
MLGEEPARDGNVGLVCRLFEAFAKRDLQESGRAPATFEAARLRAEGAAAPAREPLR